MGNKIHMYTIVSDSGFAPHVKDGLLSLACCAGPTREHTDVGTHVMGVSAASMKGVKKHLPIYFMKVTKRITFEDYFENGKYEGRVDNMYKKSEDGYERTTSKSTKIDNRYLKVHENGEDPDKSEYVLLSDDFYYFGDQCDEKELEKKMDWLCNEVEFSYTAGGNYKKVTDDDIIREMVVFFEENYEKGKIGKPNHLPERNEGCGCGTDQGCEC